jgi:hypothetical protein
MSGWIDFRDNPTALSELAGRGGKSKVQMLDITFDLSIQ